MAGEALWTGCSTLMAPVPSQGALLPRPSFLARTIQDLGIGTFRDLAVVLETAPVLTALDIFVDRRVSALPVVNEAGTRSGDSQALLAGDKGGRAQGQQIGALGGVRDRSVCRGDCSVGRGRGGSGAQAWGVNLISSIAQPPEDPWRQPALGAASTAGEARNLQQKKCLRCLGRRDSAGLTHG